jgi:hypothetical protein
MAVSLVGYSVEPLVYWLVAMSVETMVDQMASMLDDLMVDSLAVMMVGMSVGKKVESLAEELVVRMAVL